MATDLEKLVVSLSADIKSYERGLAKATSVTTSQLRKMETQTAASMGRVEKSFAKAGSALAGFGKGLVIGGIASAVAGLTGLIASSISTADAIGDLSEKLGITSTKLQELQFGAVQAEIGIDELEKGLLKFSKSLGEAQNGSGDLRDVLRANGFTDAQIKALSFGEALDIVADLIKNAKNQQDALLVTLAGFGKNGAPYLEFLAKGSAGLKENAKGAHELGTVIDEELIKAGQDLKTVWSIVMESMTKRTAEFVLTTVKEFEALGGALDSLLTVPTVPAGQRMGRGRPGVASVLDALSPLNQTPKPLSAHPPSNFAGSGGFLKPTETIIPNEKAATAAVREHVETQKEKALVLASVSAAQKLNNEVLGLSAAAEDRATAAAEKQLALDKELYDSKMALAEIAVSAFDSIIVGGEKAEEVLKRLVKQLASAAIQALLLGQGPIAGLFGGGGGLFGSLFGGGRAGGGHVNAGTAYMVGEKRPELFVPSQSGTIMPRGGGGANVVYSPTFNVGAGADSRQIEMLRNEVQKQGRDLVRNVKNIVTWEKARNPGFAR